jgi:hypothetical protein
MAAPAAHMFKVSGGELHQIEAMGFRADCQSKSGWEKWDEAGR